MKFNRFRAVLEILFIIFCFSIAVKAEAACQAETCNQPSLPARCGDGDCSGGFGGSENHSNCPQDCSATASCGDGVISNGENCQNCPADVPVCGVVCGDGIISSGENCLSCQADAGSCGVCGDGVCNCAPLGFESSTNCPQDCGIPTTTTTTTTVPAAFCGNGVCNSLNENTFNCPQDCGLCGNGICNSPTENQFNCSQDCGTCGNGVCNAPTENSLNCIQDCPCAAGSHAQAGSTTGCCANGLNFVVNGTCSVCSAATPYLYPNNNATYNNLGWGGTCRRCPETAPWDYNGTCNNCPQTAPYVINGACSACPAGQVERGGAKVGQCCPAGIPQALNDSAECCPSDIPYVHQVGPGVLECSASICPRGQSLINGTCGNPNTCNMITKVSLHSLGDAQAGNANAISYNANASGNSCASNLVNAALAYADSLVGDRGDNYHDDKVVDFLQNAALSSGGCNTIGGHWNRCINGTWYLDGNCNPISTSSLPAGCGDSQITAVVTTHFYDSSPISLIMEKNLDIDSDVTITSFAINPNEFGKWYSWKASAKAPLLVYDPAHTGVVNSATQLFGNWTFGGKKLASLLPSFQADKVQWENGYQALATLDANGDKKISAEELNPLALWFDENRDGKSQAGEVKAISEVGITALYFNPDRVDKVTSSIYATLGYERNIDGKSVTGSSVDWYATKANNPQALIADRLLRNLNQSEKTDSTSSSSKESKQAKASQKSGISGVWAWDFNLANANYKNPKGVLMFGSVKGNSLKGMSFSSSELQVPANDIAHIAKVYNLDATISKEKDGREKVTFTSSFGGAKINSQAVLSKDGSTLEGSSSVISKDQNRKAETITYQWTAVRYQKK